jgi:hypothetical protein
MCLKTAEFGYSRRFLIAQVIKGHHALTAFNASGSAGYCELFTVLALRVWQADEDFPEAVRGLPLARWRGNRG